METVLKTVGLSKKYGSRYVVRGVNMTINKGDIYGFIGKNGAGKTTFMRVILGLSEPTEGSFELFGGISREEAGRKTVVLEEKEMRPEAATSIRRTENNSNKL